MDGSEGISIAQVLMDGGDDVVCRILLRQVDLATAELGGTVLVAADDRPGP